MYVSFWKDYVYKVDTKYRNIILYNLTNKMYFQKPNQNKNKFQHMYT